MNMLSQFLSLISITCIGYLLGYKLLNKIRRFVELKSVIKPLKRVTDLSLIERLLIGLNETK